MRFSSLWVAGLVAGLVAGCDSNGERIPTHPVRGQIFYDGKPAAGVHVYLYPTSAPGVPDVPAQPNGVTDSSGRFTLSTYGNGDGAAEGGYQVVLFWPEDVKEDEEESDEDRLLGWYNAARTKLTVDIKAGENNLPPFRLPLMKVAPKDDSLGIPGRN